MNRKLLTFFFLPLVFLPYVVLKSSIAANVIGFILCVTVILIEGYPTMGKI